MGWTKKPTCPTHRRPMHPVYYRDSSGTFKRWTNQYLCQSPNANDHIVDITNHLLRRYS